MSDLETIVQIQMDWSRETFGPGRRTEGNCKHIEKELSEIRADPLDVEEWIDVAMLAIDGAWRALEDQGVESKFIAGMVRDQYQRKLRKNIDREWAPPNAEDQPNEHIR